MFVLYIISVWGIFFYLVGKIEKNTYFIFPEAEVVVDFYLNFFTLLFLHKLEKVTFSMPVFTLIVFAFWSLIMSLVCNCSDYSIELPSVFITPFFFINAKLFDLYGISHSCRILKKINVCVYSSCLPISSNTTD